MTKEEFDALIKDIPKDEQTKAAILYRASVSAGKAYHDDPTSIRLKSWNAAEKAWNDFYAEHVGGTKQEVTYSGSQVIVGSDYLGFLFGVHARTVRKWPSMGCPKVSHGKFDLKTTFDWWWDNIAKDRATSEAGDDSMNEAKRLYWWEKARGEETKNKREAEQLIPREEIAVEWSARVAEVANGLQSLAMRLPPLISGKDHREVRDIVKLNVWQILDNFSRNGRFCYPDKPKAVKKAKNAKKTVKKRKLVAD